MARTAANGFVNTSNTYMHLLHASRNKKPGRASAALKCIAAVTLMWAAAAPVKADEVAEVQKLMSSGKASEALQRADQFLAAKPRDPMMRFLKGLSLSQMGRNAEAITTFNKLTEDYPELPEPFNNLAVLYAQQGQYDKARTALEMAIRTNPSYATAYENLGDVYAKLASQAYSKALQIDTRSAVAPKLAMIRDLFPKEKNSMVAAAATAGSLPPATATPPTPAAPASPAAAVVAQKPVATPTPPTPPAATKPVQPPVAKAEKPEKPEKAEGVDGNAERDVEAAVRAWANAWSRKDLDGYFGAYARDFQAGKPRKAWEEERRARILGKRSIAVRLSAIRVKVNGDKATAQFRQDYKADALSVSSAKTLDLVKAGNSWLIVKESTGS